MTVQEALNRGRDRLRTGGIERAGHEARWLMAAALNVGPERVILHLQDQLEDGAANAFTQAVVRRLAREPVSHILGGRWFYDHWFKVTPDVLDPRPETETLVKHALAEPARRVLDLGTGSGCILLSVLSKTPQAQGMGTDISPLALAIAAQNAGALGCSDRVSLLQGDWFSNVEGRFDLILSNPPYISRDEMAALAPDVRKFEPHLALTDGADGLTAYRRISGAVRDFLNPGGRVLVETGVGRADIVSTMFRSAGLADVTVHPDLTGRPRIVEGRNPP
ncbi:MAG: peptide chain release factor N(5)-glutamine methyltransferase [Rhodobacteraceae bacterium]|nr:peptide chain release factor N(5)-glutamine methyltransferase [Paracoccaceae bacterium]